MMATPNNPLTFQLEPWASFSRDAQALWPQHLAEVGEDFEIELDGAFYSALELLGQLQILTARAAGQLVGYVVLIVRKHPHYRVLAAFDDAYYLAPAYRRGSTGIRMIEAALHSARVRGVRKVYFSSTCRKNTGPIFARMGFAPEAQLWSKELVR